MKSFTTIIRKPKIEIARLRNIIENLIDEISKRNIIDDYAISFTGDEKNRIWIKFKDSQNGIYI
jgi:hypothetical protein